MIVAWRVDPLHCLVTGGAISITSCRSHSSCAGKGAETSFPQHTPPKKSVVFWQGFGVIVLVRFFFVTSLFKV